MTELDLEMVGCLRERRRSGGVVARLAAWPRLGVRDANASIECGYSSAVGLVREFSLSHVTGHHPTLLPTVFTHWKVADTGADPFTAAWTPRSPPHRTLECLKGRI